MTTGYDHQVTAISRPKIGLGITAVGSATTNATRLPAISAVTQRRAVHRRRASTVDIPVIYPMGYIPAHGPLGYTGVTSWPQASIPFTDIRRGSAW